MSTGHPSNHGYLRCPRCKTWRPTCAIAEGEGVCNDVAWCSSQAGAGLGRLDADTGDGPRIAGNRSNSSERNQTQAGTRVDVPDDAWTKTNTP
jgi:hypothetical protein